MSAVTTNPAAVEAEAKDHAVDNNPWSPNYGKPKKKSIRVGFSFGSFDEDAKAEEKDKPRDDSTFRLTQVTKTGKKKKKGGLFDFQEKKEEPKVEVVEESTKTEAQDEWGGLGTALKSKKEKGENAEPKPVADALKIKKEELKTSLLDNDWKFGN